MQGTGRPPKGLCRKGACCKPAGSVTNLCRGMVAQACHKPSIFYSQPALHVRDGRMPKDPEPENRRDQDCRAALSHQSRNYCRRSCAVLTSLNFLKTHCANSVYRCMTSAVQIQTSTSIASAILSTSDSPSTTTTLLVRKGGW